MAFAEDLQVYLQDFGVPARLTADAPGSEKLVLLDEPDAEIFGGEQVAGDKIITYVADDFPGLVSGVQITVDGVAWKVRGAPQRLDDGRFARAGLKK
ncbi:hypothetical protein IHQ56_02735 [Methylobacillus flagellatus]|uniref:head-tail joining protein n=1 Tax=Methylobacillus flagellatus TaxID=405 RepID=UPI002853FE9A|nr:hypothetical protein [Methylobacillus flagellatus]MDR5170726.1 hypothetical protein [Methylobacillus flagellatus]